MIIADFFKGQGSDDYSWANVQDIKTYPPLVRKSRGVNHFNI